MTTEGSPNSSNLNNIQPIKKFTFLGYLSLEDQFLAGDVKFLTIRGHLSSQQKLDFVIKMLSKVSNHYLIVREANKRGNAGYHFHCLFKQVKKSNKAWYRRGLHINLTTVRKTIYHSPYTFSDRFLMTSGVIDSEGYDLITKLCSEKNDEREKRIPIKLSTSSCDRTSIRKILHYMSKDAYMPIQYTDYVYIKNKKHIRLTTT